MLWMRRLWADLMSVKRPSLVCWKMREWQGSHYWSLPTSRIKMVPLMMLNSLMHWSSISFLGTVMRIDTNQTWYVIPDTCSFMIPCQYGLFGESEMDDPHSCTYMHTHVVTYTHTHKYIHACTHMHAHTYTHIVSTHICTHTHVVSTHIHTHTCTHMHAHLHTRACICSAHVHTHTLTPLEDLCHVCMCVVSLESL